MATADGGCYTTQLVGDDGELNAEALERFAAATGLARCGLSYAVVSIIGPQSSGKSTLLNHLFGTNFKEMDASKGRVQITKGIWIAKAVGIEPLTVVLDLEGTDARERGEDDTTFEKQSALFALAVSDIVLINMWCHDIGREHAANRPLLKTVFQIMMRLFSPRKTTLLLVIRDKTKTPLEYLERELREDIQKIWDSLPKPQVQKESALSEFFNVEVTALPSFEDKEEQFKEQVSHLRQRFVDSIGPSGLAGDRRGVVPASGFCFSAQQIWKLIRENKDLNLPAHKVMVATVRCEEIANEKLRRLMSDEGWLELDAAVRSGLVPGFGRKLGAILDSYLSEYDVEAMYFDEDVRAAKRQQLESKALNFVYPAFEEMLEHLHSRALDKFKIDLEKSLRNGEGFARSVRSCAQSSMLDFDTGLKDTVVKYVDWDASKVRDKLQQNIDAHAASIQDTKLTELKAAHENKLSQALNGPVKSILEAGEQDSWASIRRIYRRQTESIAFAFSTSLSEFELDQTALDKMISDLKEHARSVVEQKAREAAGKVLVHMKERFYTVFSHDNNSMPRIWTGKEDIRMITKQARLAALKVLAVMAALRLDDKPDKIERALICSLLDEGPLSHRSIEFSSDPLASSTWEEVSPKDTLITPLQCKSIWRQFKAETEYIVAQAISMQEVQRDSTNWLPPAWAILLIALLGFNEFMFLMRNPLYLLGLSVILLMAHALWLHYDIASYFRHGTLSGLLAISANLLATVVTIVTRTVNMCQGSKQYSQPSSQPQPLHDQSSKNQTQWQAQVRGLPDSPSSSSR